MNTWVALLRGVNVGGKNALPMKELVDDLQALGCRNVKTYIQSGNAVFLSKARQPESLAKRIASAIEARRGFRPQVILIDLAAFKTAIRNNPFPEAAATPKALHVFFLASAPSNPNLQLLEDAKSSTERFALVERIFYLHAPEGVGRSKLAANAEKHLGVAASARNWSTVEKLLDLANETASRGSGG